MYKYIVSTYGRQIKRVTLKNKIQNKDVFYSLEMAKQEARERLKGKKIEKNRMILKYRNSDRLLIDNQIHDMLMDLTEDELIAYRIIILFNVSS